MLGDGAMAAVGCAPGHPRARDLKKHEKIHSENIEHEDIHIKREHILIKKHEHILINT